MTLQHFFESIWVAIGVNADPLNLIAPFPYLGRTVTYNNSNWEALYQNLQKALRRWVMVGKIVTKTESAVQSQGMMYQSVVKLVLW